MGPSGGIVVATLLRTTGDATPMHVQLHVQTALVVQLCRDTGRTRSFRIRGALPLPPGAPGQADAHASGGPFGNAA